MSTIEDRIHAVAHVADHWRDPEHEPRKKAVAQTLEAPNRWTEQALRYAIDRWMHHLTEEALGEWITGSPPQEPRKVGVLHGDQSPWAGFRDALAVWILGHSYFGSVPESSPALLPTFAEDLTDHLSSLSVRFDVEDAVYEQTEALMAELADGEEERKLIDEKCDENGIGGPNRLIREPVYSVAVLDGHETEDERERLAEDMLLYEGMGRRRVALLWAPKDLSPDPYLEAMARFRGLFPVHEDTPGTLQMQQAFLEAQDAPHAYAEGLEFLVSRGEPTPQKPGHFRWSEYDELEEVADWLSGQKSSVYGLIARRGLHEKLPEECLLRTPGGVNVPPLDDPEGRMIVSFLADVS